MQIVWHIVVVFFLLLLIVPIFAKVYVGYDVLGNIGAVSLYVFFIKIIAYKVKVSDKKLIFYTEKNRNEVPIEVSQGQLRFLEQFTVQIKQKLIVKNISVFSRIGLNDAYATAMITGVFTAICLGVMGYIKNTKKSARMTLNNIPNYNGHSLAFSAQLTGFITAIDLIYSMVMSFIIIRRSEKYERV